MTFGSIFQSMFPDAPQEQLAMFHTIFNVITVVLILPLTDALVRLVCRIIPDDVQAEEAHRSKFYFIDRNMLKTPPIAVLQTKNEIVNMAALAMRNFNLSLDMVSSLDLGRLEEFNRTEEEIDGFTKKMEGNHIARLTEKVCSPAVGAQYLSLSSNAERVGDHLINVAKTIRDLS